ncbi:MAG TPA: IS110 family transposase, partial [Acidimicrobiales bacterium]|nr:IS110 family transposase [Acidimicrobiales bacterium]
VTIIIGIDPHKATHTAVAIDETEHALAELQLAADRGQTMRLLAWAAPFEDRAWAVESADGLGKLLAQRLLAEGEHVIDVPATLAAKVRLLGSTKASKNDPNDALSTAIAGLRHCGLRRVVADDHRQAIRMLVRRFGDLTARRTQAVCRLHAVLIELIPGGMPRKLKADAASAALHKVRTDNPVDVARKSLAADLVLDVRRCARELAQLRGALAEDVDASGTTLLEVYGVGPIVAALVLGYAGDPARFATKEKFASYNGTAPIEASSGPKARHRLNPRGKPKLNHAMHLIAVTQIGHAGTPGRVFYDRKLAEGKTPKEAVRALKRRVSDAVWRQLQVDLARR